MSKPISKELTTAEIIARLEKPKSMRYIRKLMKPLFEELQMRFGNAIVKIVEREHWGPNFDAYYDVWVRSHSSEIDEFIDNKLPELENDKYVFVLVQVKETDDYSGNSRPRSLSVPTSKKRSKNGKLAGLRP